MKRYLINLMTAILARNPFSVELKRVKEEYRKTAEVAERLKELHNTAQDNYAMLERKLGDYQNLVENLRKRIIDKENLIALQHDTYEKKLSECHATIANLQQQLKTVS